MTDPAGKVLAVCISPKRGVQKREVERAELVAGHGIAGDAHAGPGHRQVSLLSAGSIEQISARGVDTFHGIFAENIVVGGLELMTLPVGTMLAVGDARLEVTQIGKECHSRCAIYEQAGDCVMPREGIFARVIRGGSIAPGAKIELLRSAYQGCGSGAQER
ncbi:MAG: MOSC domain-containing protein [Candidatus Glassbacteria bacterium]|nr:MOSC domain-containing protein [Candidatus Glassbacteria bacterium]